MLLVWQDNISAVGDKDLHCVERCRSLCNKYVWVCVCTRLGMIFYYFITIFFCAHKTNISTFFYFAKFLVLKDGFPLLWLAALICLGHCSISLLLRLIPNIKLTLTFLSLNALYWGGGHFNCKIPLMPGDSNKKCNANIRCILGCVWGCVGVRLLNFGVYALASGQGTKYTLV